MANNTHDQQVMERRRARFRKHAGGRGPSWEKEHNRMVMARRRARFKARSPRRREQAPTQRL